jgi:integrase
MPQYLKAHAKDRQIRERVRIVNRHLLPAWGDRLISEISAADIATVVGEIAETAPVMARCVLTAIKSFFGWATSTGLIDASPAIAKPNQLLGQKTDRSRFLGDPELAALWRATARKRGPYGPMLRFILLTGTRHDEAADARWDEIDLDAKLWTIPASRFKSGVPHIVPLSDMAVALLKALPDADGDHDATPYVFSHDQGKNPLRNFSQSKGELDTLVSAELGKTPERWTLHDLRRTARTNSRNSGFLTPLPKSPSVMPRKGYSAYTTSTLTNPSCVPRSSFWPVRSVTSQRRLIPTRSSSSNNRRRRHDRCASSTTPSSATSISVYATHGMVTGFASLTVVALVPPPRQSLRSPTKPCSDNSISRARRPVMLKSMPCGH